MSACQAKDCPAEAITAFLDGAGRELWLCENHGDLLAVGFPLRPTERNEQDPT